jgi:hypothetical protein
MFGVSWARTLSGNTFGIRKIRLWRHCRIGNRVLRRYGNSNIEVFHAPTGCAVVRARSASMSSLDPTVPTFQTVLRAFAQVPDPDAGTGIGEQQILSACAELGVSFATEHHHIWTPALTIWTFLSQCISTSKSCTAAVARPWFCASRWA